MTVALQFRQDTQTTLGSLEEELRQDRGDFHEDDVALNNIEFHLTSSTPAIKIGNAEVPATPESVIKFGERLQIPKPFLTRIGKEIGLEAQQTVLETVLAGAKGSGFGVRYNDSRVISVYEPGRPPLDPMRLTGIATRVLGSEAVVQRLVDETGEFAFDVHVPFTGNSGVYGDSTSLVEVPDNFGRYSWASGVAIDDKSRVQDLTAAGLRFGADLTRGLSPWIQPWSMRLACTNGMETTDAGLKVDARGQTVDEVLSELESMAEVAFARQEQQIEHFYNLRNERVDDPAGTINRLARERGLSARVRLHLIDLIPTLPEQPSMFDIVNMLSNTANDRNILGGTRMALESASGQIIADDAARCGNCHQVVS